MSKPIKFLAHHSLLWVSLSRTSLGLAAIEASSAHAIQQLPRIAYPSKAWIRPPPAVLERHQNQVTNRVAHSTQIQSSYRRNPNKVTHNPVGLFPLPVLHDHKRKRANELRYVEGPRVRWRRRAIIGTRSLEPVDSGGADRRDSQSQKLRSTSVGNTRRQLLAP